MSEERKPFLVACKPCGHVWPVAWLPMEMAACGRLLRRAGCPMCAASGRSIFVATAEQADAWSAKGART